MFRLSCQYSTDLFEDNNHEDFRISDDTLFHHRPIYGSFQNLSRVFEGKWNNLRDMRESLAVEVITAISHLQLSNRYCRSDMSYKNRLSLLERTFYHLR